MTHKIEIEDSDAQMIAQMCDLAAPLFVQRFGGVAYYNAVFRIMSLLPKAEVPPKEE